MASPAAPNVAPASTPVESGSQATTNQQRCYSVRRDQLPLSCPTPEMTLWNSHPRVYLPIEATGRARCMYCSAEFVLEDAALP